MGTVPNQRCPVCVEAGHDTGADSGHLFLMTDNKRWCCNRVHHHPNNAYVFYDNDPETNTPIIEDERPQEEEPVEEKKPSRRTLTRRTARSKVGTGDSAQSSSVDERDDSPVTFRGVPAEFWEMYGVKMFKNSSGKPVILKFPMKKEGEVWTYKKKDETTKDFVWENKAKGKIDLFGWDTLEGKIPKRLLITEGELDAVSAAAMLSKWKVKVVSGVTGDKIKSLTDHFDKLERIPELIFAPDNDDAGTMYLEEVVSLFPDIKVMSYSEKDANKMLTSGKEAEFINAFWEAELYCPPSIVDIGSIVDSLSKPLPKGLSYPWPELDELTYGISPHTILSIGSGPGVGKTTIIRAVQSHLMFHHNKPIGIFSLEESKEITLRRLVGYYMNKKIDIPGIEYDFEEASGHAVNLIGKAFIYDKRYFNGLWEKIERTIRQMYALGISHFFIDPITSLVVHLDSSGQNTALGKIMSDLGDLAQELPIYVMLVNHLNNPTSGPSHDEGGRVLPSQFTGSKSQWRFSTDMWGAERDCLNEDALIKNTTKLRILKHRTDGSKMGRYIELFYDEVAGSLSTATNSFTAVNPGLTDNGNVSERHSDDAKLEDNDEKNKVQKKKITRRRVNTGGIF